MDYEEQKKVVDTACTLAYVRHTINTKEFCCAAIRRQYGRNLQHIRAP